MSRSDQLRRDLDDILEGLGIIVSGYQLEQVAMFFDDQLEERAARRERARLRALGMTVPDNWPWVSE